MTGADGQGPASTVRLGVAGAGFIAQVAHLDPLGELEGCRIEAVADNRDELCAAVLARHRVASRAADLAALWNNPALDAFVIALPRRAMGPAIEAALGAGKPLLAEKPMAHTLAQGRRLVAQAEAAGAALAVGFMKRHDPGVALFRERLAAIRSSGELGAIAHVALRDYCATYAIPAPFHHRTRMPRPSRYAEWPVAPEGLCAEHHGDYEYTLNVASHDINLLRFLLGDPLTASGLRVRSGRQQLAWLEAPAYDIALEIGRVDTGRWEQTIDVYFQRGRLRLALPSPLARQEVASIELKRSGRTEMLAPPPERREWAFKAQARQFLDVARGLAEPVASGRDALADLELIEALWSNVRWSKQ